MNRRLAAAQAHRVSGNKRGVEVHIAIEAIAGELRGPIFGRLDVEVGRLFIVEWRRGEQDIVGVLAEVGDGALGLLLRHMLKHLDADDQVVGPRERLGDRADLAEKAGRRGAPG